MKNYMSLHNVHYYVLNVSKHIIHEVNVCYSFTTFHYMKYTMCYMQTTCNDIKYTVYLHVSIHIKHCIMTKKPFFTCSTI